MLKSTFAHACCKKFSCLTTCGLGPPWTNSEQRLQLPTNAGSQLALGYQAVLTHTPGRVGFLWTRFPQSCISV